MTEISVPLYTIEMILAADLSDDQASRFAESFLQSPLSTSMMRHPGCGWKIQFLVEEKPDRATLEDGFAIQAGVHGIPANDFVSNLDIRPVPDVNWLEESYRGFPPFRIGKFYIYGSHTEPDLQPSDLRLQIDAATAFGSGEHGTTAGCLMLLQELKEHGFTPSRVLDMGCGSGILAVAACRLWDAPVLATDIDPECVRVSNHHRDINGVEDQMETLAGDGFAAVTQTYDLIIANILAGPLIEMAPSLERCLKKGGNAILSGMLQTQADDLVACYARLDVTLINRIDQGEWTALLLQKK